VTQPDCLASLPDPVPLPDPQLPGYWLWGAIFLAVAIFELWAIWTHHRTLSQTVQHGPAWFRWALGLGLIALVVHLRFWRHG
jgi:hypothetical protein